VSTFDCQLQNIHFASRHLVSVINVSVLNLIKIIEYTDVESELIYVNISHN